MLAVHSKEKKRDLEAAQRLHTGGLTVYLLFLFVRLVLGALKLNAVILCKEIKFTSAVSPKYPNAKYT